MSGFVGSAVECVQVFLIIPLACLVNLDATWMKRIVHKYIIESTSKSVSFHIRKNYNPVVTIDTAVFAKLKFAL